jgi:hypothetical protein
VETQRSLSTYDQFSGLIIDIDDVFVTGILAEKLKSKDLKKIKPFLQINV